MGDVVFWIFVLVVIGVWREEPVVESCADESDGGSCHDGGEYVPFLGRKRSDGLVGAE